MIAFWFAGMWLDWTDAAVMAGYWVVVIALICLGRKLRWF